MRAKKKPPALFLEALLGAVPPTPLLQCWFWVAGAPLAFRQWGAFFSLGYRTPHNSRKGLGQQIVGVTPAQSSTLQMGVGGFFFARTGLDFVDFVLLSRAAASSHPHLIDSHPAAPEPFGPAGAGREPFRSSQFASPRVPIFLAKGITHGAAPLPRRA